jgi:small subunit ribosomal protein S15
MAKVNYLTPEKKQAVFTEFGKSKLATDTGSAESQIALLSVRISRLTEHLKSAHKDNSSRAGLLKLVGHRRRLLDYLYKKDIMRYRSIIKELGLRK